MNPTPPKVPSQDHQTNLCDIGENLGEDSSHPQTLDEQFHQHQNEKSLWDDPKVRQELRQNLRNFCEQRWPELTWGWQTRNSD